MDLLHGEFGNNLNLNQMLKTAFQGKKVFLTGHTGFKGSWLLSCLNYFGAIVKGYSLPPENSPNLFNLIQGELLCESQFADIRDIDCLKKSLLDFQPDYVFHLAAQPLVRESYIIPKETFEINLNGTINLLESIKLLEKECVVVMVTTDKVYENQENNLKFSEDDKLGGFDPYSASKATAEIAISSYRNAYFNSNNFDLHKKSVSVVRSGNVIGGGDWSIDRILPDIVSSIYCNKKLILRNPNSFRPWQYVLDPLFGYMKLAMLQKKSPKYFSQAYNFGPRDNDNLTVGQVVEQAILISQKEPSEIVFRDAELHEAKFLGLNIQKSIEHLGWEPKYNSKEAIKRTISWYKDYYEKDQINVLDEIVKYFDPLNEA